MGYTHHYKFNLNPSVNKDVYNQAFANAVTLFNLCRNYFPNDLKLCGLNGYGEPTINKEEVSFNGDASKDLHCESFILTMDNKVRFTKTHKLPYDIAVCCALLCFKEMFGIEFEYSSDGHCMTDYDECSKDKKKSFEFEKKWIDAITIFKQALNDMFIEEYHSEVFNKKLKYLPKKKVI